MMGSYDYINYRLTGVRSLEQNWAIESGLWMAAERRWYQPMLDLFEIPRTWLPPVHAPHDIIGPSTAEVEKQTGLPRETPTSPVPLIILPQPSHRESPTPETWS